MPPSRARSAEHSSGARVKNHELRLGVHRINHPAGQLIFALFGIRPDIFHYPVGQPDNIQFRFLRNNVCLAYDDIKYLQRIQNQEKYCFYACSFTLFPAGADSARFFSFNPRTPGGSGRTRKSGGCCLLPLVRSRKQRNVVTNGKRRYTDRLENYKNTKVILMRGR